VILRGAEVVVLLGFKDLLLFKHILVCIFESLCLCELVHCFKLLPCQGEVDRSAETEGFFAVICVELVKERFGSAENPSVSLRDPPSLGKGRNYLVPAPCPSGLILCCKGGVSDVRSRALR